jgi:hypothetical protein
VSSRQQTRVAAFLLSCHGAMARQLAFACSCNMNPAWHVELNAQLFHEMEILALLLRATCWTFDPELPLLIPNWEMCWLPKPGDGTADRPRAMTIDTVALGHALHSVIRPAALLPQEAVAQDPFALALRKIEFESGRAMQAQIMFLKSAELASLRGPVTTAVEGRHVQVRKLWQEMLTGIGVDRCTLQ